MERPANHPSRLGEWGAAAAALCGWVHAAYGHYMEIRCKPMPQQIRKAIQLGAEYLRPECNLAVKRVLPMVARVTGRRAGEMSYDRLTHSSNVFIKKIFPPSVVAPVLARRADNRGAGREGREGREGRAGAGADTFDRDIDLRASLAHFRESVAAPGSAGAGAGARRADARARPRLTALCKFPGRAFAPTAAGLRAWERFRNVGGGDELSFEEAFPAPLSVERHARRHTELDSIYKTDVCPAPRATPRALRGAARRAPAAPHARRGAGQVLDRRLRAAVDAADGEAIKQLVHVRVHARSPPPPSSKELRGARRAARGAAADTRAVAGWCLA